MRRVFLRSEGTAKNDGRSEQAEIRFGNMDPAQLLRPVSCQVKTGTGEIERSHCFENAFLALIGVKHRDRCQVRRKHAAAAARTVLELNDAIRVRVRKGLDQD